MPHLGSFRSSAQTDPAPVVEGKRIAVRIDLNGPERYKIDLGFVE